MDRGDWPSESGDMAVSTWRDLMGGILDPECRKSMAVKEIAIFMRTYDRVVICAHKYHSVSSCLRTWHVCQVCKLVELEHRQ